MKTPLRIILAAVIFICPAIAEPSIEAPEAGNVSTTSISLCWETSELAKPGLQVFADAAATQSLDGQVRIEFQSLVYDRRDVASTLATRNSTRALQTAVSDRNLVLVRVSGLSPDTEYFFRPQVVSDAGSVLVSAPLVAATTAQNVVFVSESRQLIIDLSSLGALFGNVSGLIVRVANSNSAYPLFAVVGDSPASTLAYVDLTHFLDAAGEKNIAHSSGTLDLDISWKGAASAAGSYTGDSVAFTGTTTAASSSTAVFEAITTPVNLLAFGGKPKAVVGLPFPLSIFATDGTGLALISFSRPVTISHPAISPPNPHTTPDLFGGVLLDTPIYFNTSGNHQITIKDSAGPATTTLTIETLPMTYANWREYYFGDGVPGGPGSDEDEDGSPDENEFVLATHPGIAGGSPIKPIYQADGSLRLQFPLNPHQTEYVVVVQVATTLGDWHDSSKTPVVIESTAKRDLTEVIWSPAELAAEVGTPGTPTSFFARLLIKPAP